VSAGAATSADVVVLRSPPGALVAVLVRRFSLGLWGFLLWGNSPGSRRFIVLGVILVTLARAIERAALWLSGEVVLSDSAVVVRQMLPGRTQVVPWASLAGVRFVNGSTVLDVVGGARPLQTELRYDVLGYRRGDRPARDARAIEEARLRACACGPRAAPIAPDRT
jgi:hypothetical protein